MDSQQWWVYIVQTHSGKLYTGITIDVERRFDEHCSVANAGVTKSSQRNSRGAKFFRTDPAKKVVYRECSENRSTATKREIEIKKLTRRQKCELAGLVY